MSDYNNSELNELFIKNHLEWLQGNPLHIDE